MKKYTEKKIYEFTMDYIDSNPLDICEFFDAEDIATFVSKFLTKQDARLSGYSVKLTHYCNGECALSVSSFDGTGVAHCLCDIHPGRILDSLDIEYFIGMLNEAYFQL